MVMYEQHLKSIVKHYLNSAEYLKR